MAEEKKTEVEEVEIIDERVVTLLNENLEPYEAVMVTYRYKDYPPDVVIVPKSEYSDEKLREIIKKRIERFIKRQPRKLKL